MMALIAETLRSVLIKISNMKSNPNSKKIVNIRLAKENGEILESAIALIEDDLCIEVIGQILKYENTWEFEFDDPDERFMFHLGRVYGVEFQKQRTLNNTV